MVTEDGLVKILDFGLAKLTQPDTSAQRNDTDSDDLGSNRRWESSWGRSATCHPSRRRVHQSTSGRTSSRSGRSSTRWRRDGARSSARPRRKHSQPSFRTSRSRSRRSMPGFRRPLRWIIERCLAKEPRKRYSSTDDLAKELATVRDHLVGGDKRGRGRSERAVPIRRPRWWIPAAIAAGYSWRSGSSAGNCVGATTSGRTLLPAPTSRGSRTG